MGIGYCDSNIVGVLQSAERLNMLTSEYVYIIVMTKGTDFSQTVSTL